MSRRIRLMGLLAILLAAAQLLFAAHAGASVDDASDHATQTCEFCLAGAVSGDPGELTVEAAMPAISLVAVSRPVAADVVVAIALIAAHPRGPPVS